jgi:tetratricopeptide (TPR) repeat protein
MAGHKLRHYPEAIQYYERATNLDPTFFEAYYNLGLAAYEDDDMAVSLTAYEHALSLNSDFKDLRYNFALSLLKGGYVLDAADEFQDLAALMPNDSRLHLSLANIYAQKLGDPAQARQHYQKVLSLQPHHPQAAAIRSWLAGNPE